ncbi:MAG: hypothetical protein ABL955_01845 [Elusimicrobiota bacterium]
MIVLLLVPTARADPKKPAFTKGQGVTLTLNEDRVLKGTYLEEKDGAVWISIDQGEIGVDRETIVSMKAAPNDDSEFNARKAKLSAKDAAGHWRLVQWARSKGLESSAAAEAEIVIALEPTHAGAHGLLGHELYEGKWLPRDEALKAKGYIEYRGRWVSSEEYTKLDEVQRREEMATARTREALATDWQLSLKRSADSRHQTEVEAEQARKSGTTERILIRR